MQTLFRKKGKGLVLLFVFFCFSQVKFESLFFIYYLSTSTPQFQTKTIITKQYKAKQNKAKQNVSIEITQNRLQMTNHAWFEKSKMKNEIQNCLKRRRRESLYWITLNRIKSRWKKLLRVEIWKNDVQKGRNWKMEKREKNRKKQKKKIVKKI